ncbi:MAG: stage 0 sporulation family protein [Deltaproteobacteria bacterium]|jgi:cell fate regulator YaaT (PSP1 superfamily)|nr:MAG: stage 0 sporulation family protein [Deltaproteobacteria bacterium]
MDNIVGIRFREGGKIYHFISGHFVLKEGDEIIVKTEKGLSLGIVATPVRKRDPNYPRAQLKEVFRLANDNDRQQYKDCLAREKEAHRFCQERIEERNLPMILVDVERFFDGSKIIFYFYADGRVDFRELVKDLVKKLHTRVELRQIGVRNKAKMIGGVGPCGRELCCATFLKEFHSVSVKMAKEQNLSLNPTKISGVCGRLMCCLKYEYPYYVEMKKGMPKVGKRIITPEGEGRVVRQNVMEQRVAVALDDGREIEFRASDLSLEKTGPAGSHQGSDRTKHRHGDTGTRGRGDQDGDREDL